MKFEEFLKSNQADAKEVFRAYLNGLIEPKAIQSVFQYAKDNSDQVEYFESADFYCIPIDWFKFDNVNLMISFFSLCHSEKIAFATDFFAILTRLITKKNLTEANLVLEYLVFTPEEAVQMFSEEDSEKLEMSELCTEYGVSCALYENLLDSLLAFYEKNGDKESQNYIQQKIRHGF